MLSNIPTKQDYNCALSLLSDFLGKKPEERVFSIYGSSWKENRRRIPFSDIDIFVVEKLKLLPTFKTLQSFGEKLENIHTGIPIQINWSSKRIIESPLCPERPYLEETKNCQEGTYATDGYCDYITKNAQNRNFKNDDISMISHYIRKIVTNTIRIKSVKQKSEYNDVIKLFNSYRKIFGLLSLVVRITNGDSLFSKDKPIIIQSAQDIFNKNKTGLKINKELLLQLDQENPSTLLSFFSQSNIQEILIYFESLYNELIKVTDQILLLPVKNKVVEVLSF